MARLPRMISLILLGGTSICLAKALWEMPSGSRNSSARILPGNYFVIIAYGKDRRGIYFACPEGLRQCNINRSRKFFHLFKTYDS